VIPSLESDGIAEFAGANARRDRNLGTDQTEPADYVDHAAA